MQGTRASAEGSAFETERFLVGPLQEVASVSHNHQNSGFSEEEILLVGTIIVENVQFSRCLPRTRPADSPDQACGVNVYLGNTLSGSLVECELPAYIPGSIESPRRKAVSAQSAYLHKFDNGFPLLYSSREASGAMAAYRLCELHL